MNEKNDPYADMLDLPHPAPKTRPPMTLMERAAQFSPFAALTGYDAAILEAQRRTDLEVELDESRRSYLDGMLQALMERPGEGREAAFTFFVPDERKSGGQYVTRTGRVRRLDPIGRRILLDDGTEIEVERLREIEPVE